MPSEFADNLFTGVVLDESSILKSFDGKFRTLIIEAFKDMPYKLACTATPAPNDYMELGNHAEFVGAMTRTEMLSMFFVHDGGDTAKWRLKGHAQTDYWKWVCSWAVMIRKPSDLGYDDASFVLPPLSMHQLTVTTENKGDGLFQMEAATLPERIAARRDSTKDRCIKAAEIVNSTPGYWLVWCNLNNESEMLRKLITGAVEVKGSDSVEYKEKSLLDFANGKTRVLISKASIAGFGMNLQHCSQMAFVGLSDSYEQFYQSVRRCYRFGQESEVHAHIITADTEGAVVKNIERKERDAMKMADGMVQHMHIYNEENIKGIIKSKSDYIENVTNGKDFTAYLGDACEVMKTIQSDSIHYSIFSPPFASLYTYSNSHRDMGNCKDINAFMTHFQFLIKELYRVIMPGRLLSFHCMNLPTS